MQARQIEFQFKGKRDYIHGTDIFNALVREAGAGIGNIRFTVHDFVRTPLCTLHQSDDKGAIAQLAGVKARCQFEQNGVTLWMALTEHSGDAASGGRSEYNEESIVAACSMREAGVKLTKPSLFSFIENIVAMNKHMHQQMFPEAVGKWVFTRIDLGAVCDASENLALDFKHNMAYRLTKSDILLGSNKIGDLYFSLVKS